MTRKAKIALISGGVVLVAAIVVQNLRADRQKAVEVETATVERKDLTATVSAPGRIEPLRLVDVSANTMGKIVELAVREGDRVAKGDFLLAIDPTAYETVATSAEAGVAAAEANLRQARASLEEARLEYERQRRLAESGLAAERDVIRAATARDVQAAQVQALEEEVTRARAALRGARHDLSQMRITSEISGVITKLNVEEGENAVTGTMNNPGTVLLTIADLSVLTAEVRVDETDVVNVALGQQAKVEIDAFPDTSFHGIVTEVGSSPIFRGDVFGEQAADFKVVVTLRDSIPAARPGLSATAEITTATRQNALAVPIAAVTLREWKPKEEESGAEKAGGKEGGDAGAASADTGKAPGKSPGDSAREKKGQEREGVFVVKGKKAEFRPVKTGIAGERDFEALTGLEAGDVVVTGDFRALRQLEDGDRVKIKKKKEAGREGKGRRREAEGE